MSPDLIEQIRIANNIVDVIGEDTLLKQSGNRYTGLCPFPDHNEKTPSFSVSSEKQVYHCFGCNQSGNILTYLQVKQGLHFTEALSKLADRAGISLPSNDDTSTQHTQQYLEQKTLLKINAYSGDFYYDQLQKLPATHNVKKYLEQRGINSETIKKFKIGYAPNKWHGLLTYLKQQSCDVNLAAKLGLIRKKQNHQNYYDLFRDRIMFPVFTKNGRDILGFGGRVLEDTQQPKYINSTDSPVFCKGDIFYGWQYAASAIRDSQQVLVVEGYTDYLSLYQRGIHNVVATLGTALTKAHAYWLSRCTQQVILCFDGDKAGMQAAERSLNILLSFGIAPKLLKLDAHKDPDSFIRDNGKLALQKEVKIAPDLFLYLFSKELKNYPAGLDRFSLIQKIADLLVCIKKEVLREYYISRFLDSFGFDEKVAKKALEKAFKQSQSKLQKNNIPYKKDTSTNNIKIDESIKKIDGGGDDGIGIKTTDTLQGNICLKLAPKTEVSLLILALQKPQYYKDIVDSGIIKKMHHNGVVQLFTIIDKYNTQELKYFEVLTQILSTYLTDPRDLQKEQHPSLRYLPKDKVSVFMQDCINKIETKYKHLILKDITTDMRLDKQNTKKHLLRIAEWTKNLKSMENKRYDEK